MTTEDGTGLPAANSYSSVAETTSYHADRGNADWAAAQAGDQSAALVRATDYLDATYRPLNPYPLTRTQGLQWPRYCDQGIPLAVKRAVMILALEALTKTLSTRIERGTVRADQRLEGVGELRTFYDPEVVTDHYPHITQMLRDVAGLKSATVSTGRVTREPPYSRPFGAAYPDGYGGNGWQGWDDVNGAIGPALL